MILVSIASLIGYNAKAGRSHGPWGLGLLWALESSSALVSVSGWGIWSSGLSASGREGLGAVWLAVPGLELVAFLVTSLLVFSVFTWSALSLHHRT